MSVTLKRRKLTKKQIATVLAAVAHVECWDAPHKSIEANADGGWSFMEGSWRTLPEPSQTLLDAVKKYEE